MMQQFKLEPLPLSDTETVWGDVALVPWDTQIFGFPVAIFLPREAPCSRYERERFQEAMKVWVIERNVELVSCHVSINDRNNTCRDANDNCVGADWCYVLSRCGWMVVEQAMMVSMHDLQNYKINSKSSLRIACDRDQSAVEDIASRSFRHGRYNADSVFPLSSANLRFRRWIENAFLSRREDQESTQIYIIGPQDEVHGFVHVEIRNKQANIRLNAVDTRLAPKGTGTALYEGTLLALQRQGIENITAKIASENVAALNLYAKLGFRFSDPEWVFHWHAPNAPHLLREIS